MCIIVGGCDQIGDQRPTSDTGTSTIHADKSPSGTAHSGTHPSKGPHQGTLIELGKEEFHAELVHDKETIRIYVLDSTATVPVPIDSADVVINLSIDGKPAQFKLVADPDTSDPAGMASRFVSNEISLVSHLDGEKAAPKLRISIQGKAYSGNVLHDHHDHEH
jgi:hypothetical protein